MVLAALNYPLVFVQYVTDWVADKTRCRLSVAPSEEAALSEMLARCPDVPITVTFAH